VSDERPRGSVERVQAELAVLFRRSRVHFHAAAKDVDPALTPAAYPLLIHLIEYGPKRSRDLVAWFGSDKAAISRQVSQLEELGLVQRANDPRDRRSQVIEATDKGRARAETARDRHRKAFRQLVANWYPEDVDRLADLLGMLNMTLAHAPDPGRAEAQPDASDES
jgi:DNA-binding MarR family transcriptional regulator